MSFFGITKQLVFLLLLGQFEPQQKIACAEKEEGRLPQWKVDLERRKKQGDSEDKPTFRLPGWKVALENKKMRKRTVSTDETPHTQDSDGTSSANALNKHMLRTHPSHDVTNVDEDWRSWEKARFIVKTPGQLNLQSIQVPSNSHTGQGASAVKSSKPLNLIQSPNLQSFSEAEKELGVSFSGSLMNRNIPAAQHKPPAIFLKQVQVIIFKLPSTGSTYFAELLQSIPQVHIAKELLTASDAGKPTEVLTSSMINALRQPMKGHNQGVDRSVSPTSLSVIGFTVCPLVLPFANFAAPLVPFGNSVRVVVLVRSNTVKHAVGIWRAAALRAKCHTNNLRSEQELSRCALPTRTDINIVDFQRDLRTASLHTAAILGAAYATGRDVFEITYEDLQANTAQVLLSLFQFFGVDCDGRSIANINHVASTKKFTSDNLKELLVNYYEIESFLRFRAPCYLPQLAATGPESFPPCVLPFKTIHVAQ